MKLSIISGSNRRNSQSAKVGMYIKQYVNKNNLFDDCYLCNLEKEKIEIWNPGEDKTISKEWLQKFDESDAFVLITPEWHGMASPALKNLILQCDSKEMRHKPALIVSVSASLGGSYPINELRTSCYKNNRILYIPDHVIVRNVNNVLNEFEKPKHKEDDEVRKRLSCSLNILNIYAVSLKGVSSEIDDLPITFKYGM